MSRKLMNDRGVAAVEFALVLPLLLLLFVGGFELWRFVNTTQRIERTAFQMANIVSSTEDPNQNMPLNNLQTTFNTLMGTTARDANFRVSIIGRPIDNVEPSEDAVDAIIRYEEGTLSSSYSAADVIEGIELTDRDNIVIAEIEYNHTNALGAVFQNLGLLAGGNGNDNINGQTIRRNAFLRYRRDYELDPRFPELNVTLPAEPLSCGNYRDQDRDNSNSAFENNVQQYPFLFDRNYDKQTTISSANGRRFSSVADTPHPCTCYAEGAVQFRQQGLDIQFRQQLSTCNPDLARAPFNCPTWSENAQNAEATGDFLTIEANKVENPLRFPFHPFYQQAIDLGFDSRNQFLQQVTLKCEPESTPRDRECFGFISEEDLFVPPTDPLNFARCSENRPITIVRGGGGGSTPTTERNDPPSGDAGGV